MKDFSKFGIKVPQILLPKNMDISCWSVIACDQYTQDEDYWNKAKKACENKPSTLNIILPEVYLEKGNRSERLEKIRSSMNEYLSNNIFAEPVEGFVYLERTTEYNRTRKGLVCAIDLDAYDWNPLSKNLIRATEATIPSRIPPRKEIRKGAKIESPHIMLLVNDKDGLLVEGTGKLVKSESPLYDGDLMLGSGHITGWSVTGENLDKTADALNKIFEKNTDSNGNTFMFAVGDGNHSLATAKAVWDEYKTEQLSKGVSEEEVNKSEVRYALVEIVNIYDEGLTFEPIHRVLTGFKDFNDFNEKISSALGGKLVECDSEEKLDLEIKNSDADFGVVWTENGVEKKYIIKTSIKELAVSVFQPKLDEYLKSNDSGCELDYIHGSEEVFRLGKKDSSLSIMLPPISKDAFFETINKTGPLPRKSFSMGEASEKRFYLECRKLFD